MNKNDTKKILLIGNTNCSHLWRWAYYLNKAKIASNILTFNRNSISNYETINNFIDFSVKNNGLIKYLKIFLNILKCILFINRSDYDYINFHFFEIHQAFISLFINKKYIITCWGTDLLVKYKKSRGIKKTLLDYSLKKSSAITYDSESINKIILDKCKKINKEKLYLIYWGINTSIFYQNTDKEKITLREKYKLPENSLILLSIRNLTEIYNIKEIIKWFNNNIKDKSIILFVRITPTSDKEYIKKCIKESNENPNIIFNNENIGQTNIPELYKLADISLHFPIADATPVSMLEGIACGNLIMCNKNIDSYKELSKKYSLCLTNLTDLSKDKIKSIIRGKNKIARNNIKSLQKNHSEGKTIKKISNLIKKL